MPTTSQRFQQLIDQDIGLLAEQIGIAWAELVSLGSFIEQDQEIRQSHDTFIEPIPLDVLRSLADLVQTTGPWLRRFPSAQRLDDEHARFQTPIDKVPPAREVLTVAKEGEVVRADEAALLRDTLDASAHLGYQSDKVSSFVINSVRNIAYGAAVHAISGLVEGAAKEVGEEVAKHLHSGKEHSFPYEGRT